MINIQEQVKTGFKRLSSEIRTLSSSVEPRQISNHPVEPRRQITGRDSITIDDDPIDSPDELDVFGDQEEIEEISPVYDDSLSGGEIEYEDIILQEEAQKQLVKKKRKEVRVSSINI